MRFLKMYAKVCVRKSVLRWQKKKNKKKKRTHDKT